MESVKRECCEQSFIRVHTGKKSVVRLAGLMWCRRFFCCCYGRRYACVLLKVLFHWLFQGALWHIYSPSDTDKIRRFLLKVGLYSYLPSICFVTDCDKKSIFLCMLSVDEQCNDFINWHAFSILKCVKYYTCSMEYMQFQFCRAWLGG